MPVFVLFCCTENLQNTQVSCFVPSLGRTDKNNYNNDNNNNSNNNNYNYNNNYNKIN